MRRGRKNSWGRTMDCSTRKIEKLKGGKNRDKKILRIKLSILDKRVGGTKKKK
jgi:hypothetical protein